MYVRMYMCVYVSMRVCIHVCMCVYMYICMYVYIYACMCTCVCMRVYIYKYPNICIIIYYQTIFLKSLSAAVCELASSVGRTTRGYAEWRREKV